MKQLLLVSALVLAISPAFAECKIEACDHHHLPPPVVTPGPTTSGHVHHDGRNYGPLLLLGVGAAVGVTYYFNSKKEPEVRFSVEGQK